MHAQEVADWTLSALQLPPRRVTELALSAKEALRPGPQRARGEGRISVRWRDGRVRVERLYQDGCAKLRAPRDPDIGGVEAVLINTAGGMTGGDQLSWTAAAGENSQLTLTSQACERIYRSAGGPAEVDIRLRGETGSSLYWLPQETILFDGGELDRRLEANLASNASLLAVESVVLGRTAMGEQVRRGRLRDRWRIRRDGRLVFADDVRLEGAIADTISAAPVLAGARAFASILLVGPGVEAKLPELRAALGRHGGASAFDGKLFGRLTAEDGFTLRRALVPALEVLRAGPLPRVWRS